MEIKELFTFDIVDEKVVYKKDKYKVWKHDGLYSVYNMDETRGWSNLPEAMYNRMYGESVENIVSNRRKWLIEIIMPERLKYLNSVNDEILTLSIFLNETLIKD